MAHIFISHASADDAFVAELRVALESHGLAAWVDSRNLRAGNKLAPAIEAAIADSRQVIAVLSLQTVNSPWVRREIAHALQIEAQRQGADYRVIPLLLPGMTVGALGNWFDDEPLAVPISLGPGGLSEGLPALLAALGERLPTDTTPPRISPPIPTAELILELTAPQIVEEGGKRRARATARLIFQPADATQRPIESALYRFTAPLGPIEGEELRWYLEDYNLWPHGQFARRAQTLETNLPQWGQQLYQAGLGTKAAANALTAWRSTTGQTLRRVSIKVERELPEGSTAEEQASADEAASLLLGLPWELLHDEGGYLLHGRHACHIRRQLPNRKPQNRQPAALPVRVLLLSPRPEEAGIGYIDHRSSALPLVTTVENLGELVHLTVLTPPTLAALEAELQRAAQAGEPYAVVHFDGHGSYDRRQGLGALCFEQPAVNGAPPGLDLVYANDLAALVRNYGIPLVFLDACQSAQVESDPRTSVAAALLEEGVSAVVAMRHSVLVETARRFVEAFYTALATGKRVGEALLAGQQALKGDSYRGQIRGAGDLRLADWFVPVLYQEQPDPQLFDQLPSQTATQLLAQRRRLALGDLPATPSHTFVGRSHELLRLERLLAHHPYVVIRGQGGAGKTTIAVELARWLWQTNRCRRVAFVSLEERGDPLALLDSLGHQLLPGANYSVAHYPDLATALQPVARALADHATIIVIDNVESILETRDTRHETGEGRHETGDTRHEGAVSDLVSPVSPLVSILTLCQALLAAAPATRLIFTSRERLPEPFGAGRADVELGALRPDEAIQLVEKVLRNEGWTAGAAAEPAEAKAAPQAAPQADHETLAGDTPKEVTELVEAVGCHARALVLLAREVARQGVSATTATVQPLMAELERKYPGQRENSLFASVELSLRRLPPAMRKQVQGLAVLEGGGHLWLLSQLLEVDTDTARAIALALIDVGLAEDMGYGYLRLDPALPPYLLTSLPADRVATLRQRWGEATMALVDFLYQQRFKDTQLAAQLTLLERPNLRALLAWLPANAAPEQIVAVAGRIESLLANLGQRGLLAQFVSVREGAAQRLGGWSHALFESERLRIERSLQRGDLQSSYQRATALCQGALAAGEVAYADAAYDLAMAHFLLGRVLKNGGQAKAALTSLGEAQRCFEALVATGNASAARMASVALTEQGDCLRDEGRLDEAATAYAEAKRRAQARDDARAVATNTFRLGTVCLFLQRYADALTFYEEARTIFDRLGEPGTVAGAWYQIGSVHRKIGSTEAAERAHRQGLALRVQHNLRSDQGASLTELGNLYGQMGRLEDAVTFYRQAADIAVELKDQAKEGLRRSNLADKLIRLGRYDEARTEIERAIACDQPFGHAAEPWKTWAILHNLERAVGDGAAAQGAWQQARACYLAYRRDGGYAQFAGGRLLDQFWAALQAGEGVAVVLRLDQLEGDPATPAWQRTLLTKVRAILAGSRDPALADDPVLDYDDAAEVLLLIERVGGRGSGFRDGSGFECVLVLVPLVSGGMGFRRAAPLVDAERPRCITTQSVVTSKEDDEESRDRHLGIPRCGKQLISLINLAAFSA